MEEKNGIQISATFHQWRQLVVSKGMRFDSECPVPLCNHLQIVHFVVSA